MFLTNVGVNQLLLQLVAGRSPVAGDFQVVLPVAQVTQCLKLGERCVTSQKPPSMENLRSTMKQKGSESR